jgi:hypothetical protein
MPKNCQKVSCQILKCPNIKMPIHSITKAFWPLPPFTNNAMLKQSNLKIQCTSSENAQYFTNGHFPAKKVLQHCCQVTLPSSVIHSPNCFISNQVFAKSVSTQTPNANQNFLSSVFPNGGRHCLSIIYQTGHNPIKLTFSSTPTA